MTEILLKLYKLEMWKSAMEEICKTDPNQWILWKWNKNFALIYFTNHIIHNCMLVAKGIIVRVLLWYELQWYLLFELSLQDVLLFACFVIVMLHFQPLCYMSSTRCNYLINSIIFHYKEWLITIMIISLINLFFHFIS